jgi:hypothetical protein
LPEKQNGQAVLVTLQPKGWVADLYIREGENETETDEGGEIRKFSI